MAKHYENKAVKLTTLDEIDEEKINKDKESGIKIETAFYWCDV